MKDNRRALLIVFISIALIVIITIVTAFFMNAYNEHSMNTKETITRTNAENLKSKADEYLKNDDKNKAVEYYYNSIIEYKKIDDRDRIYSIELILKNLSGPDEQATVEYVDPPILYTN